MRCIVGQIDFAAIGGIAVTIAISGIAGNTAGAAGTAGGAVGGVAHRGAGTAMVDVRSRVLFAAVGHVAVAVAVARAA